MLGIDEPPTYVVAMLNNAELRSAGGIAGAGPVGDLSPWRRAGPDADRHSARQRSLLPRKAQQVMLLDELE